MRWCSGVITGSCTRSTAPVACWARFAASNGTFYTGPFSLGVTANVKAIAYSTGLQASQAASASFTIAGSGPGIGLKGQFFGTSELSDARMIRTDPTIDFAWAEAALQPGQPLARRRLADPQLTGGGCEAAPLGDQHQQPQRLDVGLGGHAPRL